MAEKARLFNDHHGVELTTSSPDPSTHKRIGRGVRNFDSAVWDGEKQNSVLSGNYAKFTQNPAMKNHLLSIGSKRLADASPLEPVWSIAFWADDSMASVLRRWRGTLFICEELPAVHDAIHECEAGSAHPTSPCRSSTPTEFPKFTRLRQHRRPARHPWPALAKVLLQRFRRTWRTHRPNKAIKI